MRPFKLGLKLEVPVEEDQPPDFNASFKVGDDGITVISNSINSNSKKEFQFNTDGLVSQGSYKISEKDIKIIKTLGRGASSTVYKGFLFRENKFVAIKKINIFEKETRHQMMNDVKALCDAPNVPGLIEFIGAYSLPDSGQICVVLEYMEGGSLADVLQKVRRIPENILSKITARVLQGLAYLHRNKHMVHRDIKPANILINLEGDPKITDFGISAFVHNTLAVCHTFLGTVTYMSPERINNKPYSFAADIWSLGLALIECATGTYPYDATVGPLQLMIHVVEDPCPLPPPGEYSEEFRDFIGQCMQKDPYKRPPAESLLRHPFITKYAKDPVDLKSFMQCAFNPNDKLDEIAIVFAWNYHALLSAGPQRLADLEPLYLPDSVLAMDGVKATGRQQIIGRLRDWLKQNSALGSILFQVQHTDTQPLGLDGTALVLVQGSVFANPHDSYSAPFAASFVLCQARPGEYYVARQMFRMLAPVRRKR